MHIIHGQVRKAPMIKQLQDSTMFIVELSEMVKDYKTGEKTYTNYKAMLFAKTPAAIDYYTSSTAEGNFIVLTSEKLKVETFNADSGKTYITLMMDNARLEGAQYNQGAQQGQPQQQQPQYQQQAPQMAPAPQQQAPQYQQAPQHAPQQQQAAQQQAMPYDDNIPF
jgi:single-strand DNA-binding protein